MNKLFKKENKRDAVEKMTEYIVNYFSRSKENGDKYYLNQLEKDCESIFNTEDKNSKLIFIVIEDLVEEGLVKEVESDDGKYLVLTDRVKTFMNI